MHNKSDFLRDTIVMSGSEPSSIASANLMQVLKFTDADLKANRVGYMTKRQMERYFRRMRCLSMVQAGFGVVVGLIALYGFIYGLRQKDAGTLLLAMPCSLMALLPVFLAMYRYRQTQ